MEWVERLTKCGGYLIREPLPNPSAGTEPQFLPNSSRRTQTHSSKLGMKKTAAIKAARHVAILTLARACKDCALTSTWGEEDGPLVFESLQVRPGRLLFEAA
jgi:hypothetical protein